MSTRPSSPGPTSAPNVRPSGMTLRSGMQPVDVAERHQQHAALVEAHDLGEHRLLVGQAGDATELGQADVEAGGLDDESDDARHASESMQARQVADARRELVTKHRSAPCGGTRARARCRRGRRRCGRGPRSRQPPRDDARVGEPAGVAVARDRCRLRRRRDVAVSSDRSSGLTRMRTLWSIGNSVSARRTRFAHESSRSMATSRATIWRATTTASAAMFSSRIAGRDRAGLAQLGGDARARTTPRRSRVACAARARLRFAVGESARVALVDQPRALFRVDLRRQRRGRPASPARGHRQLVERPAPAPGTCAAGVARTAWPCLER